jgi:hypothetical protein
MHKITILWGECPEDGQEAVTYRFDTKAELDAFELGVAEMQLRQEAVAILSNHLADLDYWCAAYTVDDVNSVTGGCEFDDLADLNAYRVVVKAVMKEMKNA